MAGNQRLWTAYLIANLVSIAVLVGVSWAIVYFLAWVPLQEEGGISSLITYLKQLDFSSTLWWREFLARAFDVLIILVGIVGTWWVLGHFAVFAREQGKWRRYYRSEEGKRDVWVLRFSLWQRIQHIWMMITFIVCAFTGFVMYLGNNPYWKMLYANRELYIEAHVISGWLMGVVVLLHFGYYTTRVILDAVSRREKLLNKWPMLWFYTLTFVKNLTTRMLCTISPRLGRCPKVFKYDCEQLFEYWGVYWGMAVLGIPGAIMSIWGPQVLNGVFWITHVKEAVLAVTFILMVHISYAHLNPLIFPMDPTYIHGKMPLRRIKEEHVLWYEYLVKKGVVEEKST